MTSISGISGISGSFTTQQTALRPPPPRDGKDPVSAVPRALGLSGDELKHKLESGQSLSEVAEQRGVSHDDLIAAIKAGKPSDAQTGTEDDDAVAERIAAQKSQPGPPPGGPRRGAAGLSDESKLQQLSSLLETDSESLRRSSATDVVKRMQDKGIDLAQLRSVLNNGDLIDFSF